VYAIFARIFSNKGLRTYLEQHPTVTEALGFRSIPHRTTISRWRRKHQLMQQVISKLGDVIQVLIPSILLIFDSTPLEDKNDPEAKIGYYSRGPFKGFKAHMSVNQSKMPIRAVFTPGNMHDSPHLPELAAENYFGLGDAGYDSKANREIIRQYGGEPVIDINRRNTKKAKRRKWLLKKYRYLIEQVNEILKNSILQGMWIRIKGFAKKATFAYSGIAAMQVIAIDALVRGEDFLPRISLYW
jgi:hypothetical protein